MRGSTRPLARSLDLRRLRSPRAYAAIAQMVVMASLDAVSTAAAGWMAANPSARNLALLGVGLIGATICYVTGNVTWSALIDRAEGDLRADLLGAALAQPISVLGEQAAGGVLDRVDDDARAVGVFFRESVWVAGRLVVSFVPMWLVAGLTWWPAAVMLPILVLLTILVARGDMSRLAKAKIAEEAAWTDHAATFEEAVTARDDLRTSLGQPYAIRRLAELSAIVHRRRTDVAKIEYKIVLRTGLLVQGFLAAMAIIAVYLATHNEVSVAQLITLFLVTQIIVSSVTEFVEYLPGIQEGYGSILRVRQLFDVAPEPVGGAPVPAGQIGLEIRDLNFAYNEPTEPGTGAVVSIRDLRSHSNSGSPANREAIHWGEADGTETVQQTSSAQTNPTPVVELVETPGLSPVEITRQRANPSPVVELVETTPAETRPSPVVELVEITQRNASTTTASTTPTPQPAASGFALQHISLSAPPGQTIALIGRTGSGKSTLAALLSRAVEPPPGTMFLGGVDVRDLDLQALRGAVGVVTQQTQILAGTLRENLTLFAAVPPGTVERAVGELGLTDWVAGLPDGLDTRLGAGGTKLSAGEEQLVAFARLLVRDVQVVVLDEATARMDPQTEALVVNAAGRLLANRTGVLIAHRLSTIERADLVAVLEHGRMVQFGEREALAAVPGAYQALLADADAAVEPLPPDAVVSINAPVGAHSTDGVASASASTLVTLGQRTNPGPVVDAGPLGAALETTQRTASATAVEPLPPDAVVSIRDLRSHSNSGSPMNCEAIHWGKAEGVAAPISAPASALGSTRRTVDRPDRLPPRQGMSLMRAVVRLFQVHWRWGLLGGIFFTTSSFFATQGPVTGYLWGHAVTAVQQHRAPWVFLAVLAGTLLIQRVMVSYGVRWYPLWWIQNLLRIRLAIMRGQTEQRRLAPTPAGEVVARAMDADRLVFYADRWIDFVSGFLAAAVTAAIARSWLAGGILLAVIVVSAASATLGRSIAGRSAKAATDARAQFGRALVSALEAMRTVKLAARTDAVQAHLRQVDAPRVRAAVFEHRVRAILGGVPPVMCYAAAFAGWALFYTGHWSLPTTLLVTSSALGFVYYGIVSGAVVTEYPGARAWQLAANAFADGADLMAVPPGVSLVDGTAPLPPRDRGLDTALAGHSTDGRRSQPTPFVEAVPQVVGPSPTNRFTIRRGPRNRVPRSGVSRPRPGSESTPLLELRNFTVIHDDDGTVGVQDVDLAVRRGELVLLLGRVGSGKSSLLAALAGLLPYEGELCWDGELVPPESAELFLRPPQVAYASQTPHLVSGTIADNVRLDYADRELDGPIRDAQMAVDVAEAGGLDAVVGTRGVRLSGGQAQRLALARALACAPQLLVADDISSALDATTELELWDSLRARGTTVIGATSKAAALARADRVVVLVGGQAVASGPWTELAPEWSHLAG